MCGINGIYEPIKDAPSLAPLLQKMNQSLAHRGPDASDQWEVAGIGLAHTRLAIIDLSDAGRQPMQDVSGRYTLTFNGEIYNYLELKAELSGYPFRTQTDTEVILAAFSCWGAACIPRLNGMFAFALWDEQEQQLWLVRDQMGIKPLYYHHDPLSGRLVFASEIRALLATGLVKPQLDTDSLANYLRYQTVHTPDTMIAGLKMLPPASWLCIGAAGIQEQRYWQPQRDSRPGLDAAGWQTLVRRQLRQTIAQQMTADVPFGAFLSGGIDSSVIVALMAEVSSQPVKTFTVTFDEAAYDESQYARMVSERYHTEHCDIRLKANDFLNLLPEALSAMDHPSGDGPNTYVVAKATRAAGITMALSGLGSDEVFGGYAIFRQIQSLESSPWLLHSPWWVRRLVAQMWGRLQPTIAGAKIAAVLSQPQLRWTTAYPLFRQVFLDPQIEALLTRPQLPDNRVAQWLQNPESGHLTADWPLTSRVSQAEFYTYMQDVLLRDTDQMTMAHALEVRVPFLDPDLVSLVLNAPDAVKLGPGPKTLLVQAMSQYLPQEVIHRPKMGFTLPFERWMKTELRSFCEERLHRLGQRPYFKAAIIQQYWQSFLAGNPRLSWSRLWALVVLEHWLSENGVE